MSAGTGAARDGRALLMKNLEHPSRAAGPGGDQTWMMAYRSPTSAACAGQAPPASSGATSVAFRHAEWGLKVRAPGPAQERALQRTAGSAGSRGSREHSAGNVRSAGHASRGVHNSARQSVVASSGGSRGSRGTFPGECPVVRTRAPGTFREECPVGRTRPGAPRGRDWRYARRGVLRRARSATGPGPPLLSTHVVGRRARVADSRGGATSARSARRGPAAAARRGMRPLEPGGAKRALAPGVHDRARRSAVGHSPGNAPPGEIKAVSSLLIFKPRRIRLPRQHRRHAITVRPIE